MAELEALLQCLEFAVLQDQATAIYSDCRSVVQWLENFQKKKGIHVAKRVAQISHALTSRTTPIVVYWIPGHWDIHGNDQADSIAKAMLENDFVMDIGSKRQNMAALLKSRLARSIAQRQRLRSHRPSYADQPKALYNTPFRYDQQLTIWLRTGHSPLQAHMHRTGRADDPFCQHCSQQPEGRRHLILECPKYETLRRALIDPILARHQGCPMQRSDPLAIDFLLEDENIQDVIVFCRQSGRFCRRT